MVGVVAVGGDCALPVVEEGIVAEHGGSLEPGVGLLGQLDLRNARAAGKAVGDQRPQLGQGGVGRLRLDTAEERFARRGPIAVAGERFDEDGDFHSNIGFQPWPGSEV